jgi:hypothetical protein
MVNDEKENLGLSKIISVDRFGICEGSKQNLERIRKNCLDCRKMLKYVHILSIYITTWYFKT